MTVCVAAVCNTGTVFGASDCMLTAGDVQFEPTQAKTWFLTNSISAMVAGDSAVQTEVLQAVTQNVGARIRAKPADWWLVQDVAELYCHYYGQLRQKRAEREILIPLGLTTETFLSNQRQLSDSFVLQTTAELGKFMLPSVATIVAGADPTGTHIFIVADGRVDCLDSVGFAAIGAGRWHAQSQFMFAKHDRLKPFPETLLLTYGAKRRAEVAPGVGQGTDMFTIGPELGSFVQVAPDVIRELDRMYKATRAREATASLRANTDVNKYFQRLKEAATANKQVVAQPPDGTGSTAP